MMRIALGLGVLALAACGESEVSDDGLAGDVPAPKAEVAQVSDEGPTPEDSNTVVEDAVANPSGEATSAVDRVEVYDGHYKYSHEYFQDVEIIGLNIGMSYDEAAAVLEGEGFSNPGRPFTPRYDPTTVNSSAYLFESSAYAFERGPHQVTLFRQLMPDGTIGLREIRFREDFDEPRIIDMFMERMVERFGAPTRMEINDVGEPDGHNGEAEWDVDSSLGTDMTVVANWRENRCGAMEDQIREGCPTEIDDRIYARRQDMRRRAYSGIRVYISNRGNYQISLVDERGASDTLAGLLEEQRQTLLDARAEREARELEADPF